jgi:hypothetical protein
VEIGILNELDRIFQVLEEWLLGLLSQLMVPLRELLVARDEEKILVS